MLIPKPSFFLTLAAAVITAHTASVAAVSCGDGACDPDLECGDITWTCKVDQPTPAPGAPPREENYCCDYLGTCTSGEEKTGVVKSHQITVKTDTGVNHQTKWVDFYSNNTVSMTLSGSWISFIDNFTTAVPDGAMQSIVDLYVEPEESCTNSNRSHMFPGWYHIALACVENGINITGLEFSHVPLNPCPQGPQQFTYTCDTESQTCVATTDLDKSPNSTIPKKVTDIHCNKSIEGAIQTVEASSVLISDLDGRSIADHLMLLNGWVPKYDDTNPFIKVVFSTETFVVGVVMQGLTQDIVRRVDSFEVEYENTDDGTGNWVEENNRHAVFNAGARLDTSVENYFLPIKAKAVTIHVKTPAKAEFVGMRFKLVGCGVCLSDADCDADGQCLLNGECKYGSDVISVDPAIVNEELNELAKKNVTEKELDTFKTILGQGEEGSSLETVDPDEISLDVADAVFNVFNSVLTKSSSSNTSEPANQTDEETLGVLEAVDDFLNIGGETGAVQNLTTPEARKAATALITNIADVFSELLSEENSATWDAMASRNKASNETANTKKVKTALGMLNGMTAIVGGVASQQSVGESIEISTENLEGVSTRADPAKLKEEGFSFETKTDSNLAGTSLQITSKNLVGDGGGLPDVTITVGVLGSSALLPKTQTPPADDGQANGEKDPGQLVSNLLAIKVSKNGKPTKIPVGFSMAHRMPQNDSDGNPIEETICVYHDETVTDKLKMSMDGLRKEKRLDSEENKTDCSAGHITTFAVMMFLGDTSELKHHLEIQSMITIGCGALSVLFVAAAVLVFVYLRGQLMSERIIIHITLMVVTGVAILVFMLGSDKHQNKFMCKVVTVVLHFLYTSMFSWMLVEGVHLYRQIITVFESGKSRLWVYFVVGWGIPVIIVGASTGIQWDKYGQGDICFLDYEDGTLWAFVGPIIPVILVNFFVLCRVIQIVMVAAKLEKSSTAVDRVKAGVRSSVMLLPLLGVTWVFGYFQALDKSWILSYIFVILNSLQGFFMAVFHCFLNTEVRENLRSAIKKIQDSSIGGESTVDTTNKKSLISSSPTPVKTNKVAPIFDD